MNEPDRNAARVIARLFADNASTAEIVSCLQAMAAGSNDQALLLLNEAHDQIDQACASAALDLRTQSKTLKA